MGKLIIKNFLEGLIYTFFAIGVAALILACLSLLAQLIMPFSVVHAYIIGAIISLFACLVLKNFITARNGYFLLEDIENENSNKKTKFWIDCIQQKRFIKRKVAIIAYVPSFVISGGIIALAVILYSNLLEAGAQSYVGYAVLCAIIGAAAVSWLLHGILGIMSLQVCKKCGSVNAFIYDEDLEFNMVSRYRGEETPHSSGVNAYGMRGPGSGGAGFDSRKLKKYGYSIARHCACCGEKSTYMETGDESSVLQ